jgi:thiamine-monophosphate kinase
MDEFGIIARYFAPLAKDPGALKLKDDAAFIPPRPGFDLVITTDQIAADTDFFPHDPPATVAKKALRVNLSDLAAKGATPEFYLLNLALPHSVHDAWLTEFAAGFAEDQSQFGISLLGGDTSASEGPLSISITAFGFVPQGKMVKRSGAKVGDAVYVTGTIGDSAGGLAVFKREIHQLSDAQRDYLTRRYQVPEPPVVFGAGLSALASAAIDVSDGLIADLGHLADASKVKIELDAEAIPRSEALRAFWGDGADAILRAATAGDDYQIAFTAPPGLSGPFTRIGGVQAGEGVGLIFEGKQIALPRPGYRHF